MDRADNNGQINFIEFYLKVYQTSKGFRSVLRIYGNVIWHIKDNFNGKFITMNE